MDISKNSIIRFLFYIGIIVSSVNIYNFVYYHFLYAIRRKILCPALGSVAMCELAETAGWMGVVTGNVLICLLLLKSGEKLKNSRVLKKLEYLICFVQVLIQLWLAGYFTVMAADAGSHEDVRIMIFISYFALNALLFLINGILSFLEELTRDRLYG
jgi:hypothetical protein